MSTKAQLEAYGAKDRTPQENEIVRQLMACPLLTIRDLSISMDLPKSTITARITGLRKKGQVFPFGETVQDGTKYTCWNYDNTPAKWPCRAADYAKTKDLEEIEKFGKKWKQRMTEPMLEAFRELYRRVKATNYAS